MFNSFLKKIRYYNFLLLVPRIAQDPEDTKSYHELALEHEEMSILKKMLLDRINSGWSVVVCLAKLMFNFTFQ